MSSDRSRVRGTRTRSLAIWAAMVLLGGTAWQLSGTPYIGACAVVAVLLAVISPPGALYGTCAAIPLVYHPIQVGSLELSLLEIGILATVAGTLIRLVFDYVEHGPGKVSLRIRFRAYWLLPTTLLIIGTFSLAWMPFDVHRAEALRTWRWVILEPLMMFLLARAAVGREGRAFLATAIVLPSAAIALAAMWQLGSASTSFTVDDVLRSTATYLHPNNLALYLERGMMLALTPALLLKSRWSWLYRALTMVIVLGLVTTFSRGAMLGLFAGFAVMLLAHPVRHGWKFLGAGTVAAVAVFSLFASARLSGSDSSGFLDTRRYLWQGAGAMIRDFPMTGIGLDQFLWMNQQRYIAPRIWSERYVSHPHNFALDSWLSLGAPGLVLLVVFLCAGGWFIWQTRTSSHALSPWQLGALGCLGAGLGHGLVDNGYFLADLSVFTWLAIAMVIPSASADRQVFDV